MLRPAQVRHVAPPVLPARVASSPCSPSPIRLSAHTARRCSHRGPLCVRAALVLVTCGWLAACGAAPAPPLLFDGQPTAPPPLQRGTTHTSFEAEDLPDDVALDDLVQAAWQAAIDRGFAPVPASPTLVLPDGVRYFTVRESLPSGDVLHVLILAAGPWDAVRDAATVTRFARMPAGTPQASPVFHFISTHPPTEGTQYLLGNSIWGALESALTIALDGTPTHDSVPAALTRIYQTLDDWGLGAVRDDVRAIDAMLDAMPADDGDQPYLPTGTLHALGLVLGEQLRTSIDGTTWEDGLATLSTGVSLRLPDGGVARPLDWVRDAYRDREHTRAAREASQIAPDDQPDAVPPIDPRGPAQQWYDRLLLRYTTP